MSDADLPHCRGCLFWAAKASERKFQSYVTDCRRHAPIRLEKYSSAAWPQTAMYDWCGEWRGVVHGVDLKPEKGI